MKSLVESLFRVGANRVGESCNERGAEPYLRATAIHLDLELKALSEAYDDDEEEDHESQ